MNHYDDLQRFKDKTRTQSLEFKDLSAQTAASERGDWAILDQLSPPTDKDATLAVGGSVSQIVPQPVKADAFVPQDVAPLHVVAARHEVAAESRAASIMQSVSTQMAPPAEPETVSAPEPTPIARPEPVVQSAPQGVVPPVAAPAPKPVVTAENVNYSRLFAPKSTDIPGKAEKEEKDQPLKSLLERIASCR